MLNKRRVMLKLSGEALAGEKGFGFNEESAAEVAQEIKKAYDEGVQIAIVIGGGNIWRGRSNQQFDRVKSDQIGMMATVMNCIYVSEIFRNYGMKTRVYSAFAVDGIARLFDKDDVVEDLESGRVVFFAGGTGHPYFSTDSGVAIRAIEIEADCILLAKNIDGVYSADPGTHPEAIKYESISIGEVVEKGLQVIDMTASVLCKENHMPLAVFSLKEPKALSEALEGRIHGTVITAE